MFLTATFFAENTFLLTYLSKMLPTTILIRERLDKFDNIHIISVSHKIAFYILVVRYRTSKKINVVFKAKIIISIENNILLYLSFTPKSPEGDFCSSENKLYRSPFRAGVEARLISKTTRLDKMLRSLSMTVTEGFVGYLTVLQKLAHVEIECGTDELPSKSF